MGDVLVAVPEETSPKAKKEKASETKKEEEQPAHTVTHSLTNWLWKHGDLNPDYRLAVLNAANEGFQSKMNADVGSYVIHGFWKRAMPLLKEKGEVPRLGKIFKEIQYDLGEWKQFPDFKWNNDTANVVLKRRKKADVKKVVAVGGVEVEGVEVELADIVLQS